MIELDEVRGRLDTLREGLVEMRGYLDIATRREVLAQLEENAAKPDFWNDQASAKEVIAKTNETTDESAAKVCRDIARAFEEQLTYPGEIRVTVIRETRVTEAGLEQITLPIGTVQARHFVFSGEFSREVWYDEAGVLVASQMEAKDGSIIRQELLRMP